MSSSEGLSMPMVSKMLIDIILILLSWKAETVGNLLTTEVDTVKIDTDQ